MKKQQVQSVSKELIAGIASLLIVAGGATWWFSQTPVSYTHLTLPTNGW
jgi:hypothetical protein